MNARLAEMTAAALRGIGQIMLQENAATGLLFLAGISYGSINMGFAALLATITGTLTAYVFHYDEKEIEQGLYGFSPALVGVATMVFLKPVFISWLIVIVGSIAAAAIQHFFIRRNIPVFTLPFVLVTWCILYSTGCVAPRLLIENTPFTPAASDKYLFAFKGYAQVIFQASLLSGILFFAGVLISSPAAALYGLMGAVISGMLAYYFVPVNDIANGLLSYNAVLCAIVFAGKGLLNNLRALISVTLSVIFCLLMMKFQFIALTFPFVLATWLALIVRIECNGKTDYRCKRLAESE